MAGSRPARSASLSRRPRAAPYSSGGTNNGIHPSPRRAARRSAASLDPPTHTGIVVRRGQLGVAVARGDRPGAAQGVDPLVEAPAPGAELDARGGVLPGVGADADPEHEPAPRQWASAAASFATDGAWRSGSCKTHVPMAARLVAVAATPSALEGLEGGAVPEEVVADPQRAGPAGLGSAAQVGQGGRARELGRGPGGTWGG